MLVALMVTAFCTVILTLFLRNALEDLKYRQQMQFPACLKIEAYSALELALSFLSEYKQSTSAEKVNENESVGKEKDKLIFDGDILGGTPDSILIANYITKKVSAKLAKASLSENFSPVTPLPIPNQLKHGEFTIQYEFEDLSAKIPFCKQFFDTAGSSFRSAIMDMIPSSSLGFSEKSSVEKFIDNRNTFAQWSSVEQVARGENFTSSSSELNIEPLKEWFSIEPYIIKASDDKKFKLNLLMAKQEILNAVSRSQGSLAIPSSKTIAAYKDLISKTKALDAYCSTEIQFFALRVRVIIENGNAYTIRCVCSCMTTSSSNAKTSGSIKTPSGENKQQQQTQEQQKRLPFDVIKMEEF
ncbi:MAG: hypothetical protein LBS71_00955 [Puniceicoccales bacterium]|jgi:hypothetical protein|nr:hypothetical protein [Puniceicoccales bacterium]